MDFFKGFSLNENNIKTYFYDMLYTQLGKVVRYSTYVKDENKLRQLKLDALHHRATNTGSYKLYKDIDIDGKETRVYDTKIIRADYKKNTERLKRNQYKLEFFVYKVYKKILQYCPIDTGNLRASIRVVRNHGADNSYCIYTNCEYAAAVHEIFKATHAHPTCAKFMQRPAYEVSNEYDNPYNIYLGIKEDNKELFLIINGFNYNLVKGSQPGHNKKELEQSELIRELWVKDEIPMNDFTKDNFGLTYTSEGFDYNSETGIMSQDEFNSMYNERYDTIMKDENDIKNTLKSFM